MKAKLIFIALAVAGSLQAQDTLTLAGVRKAAREHYPGISKGEIYHSQASLELENLQTNYYPQLSLGARASWQSDVTTIALEPGPGASALPFSTDDLFILPELRNDNYRATAEISQVIWDGGATKEAKALKKASLEAALATFDNDVYHIGETANTLFFRLLMLREKEQVLLLTREELISQQKALLTAIDNGTLPAFNADAFEAELLALEQNIASNTIAKKSIIKLINILTGNNFSTDTPVKIPEYSIPSIKSTIIRPELRRFNASINVLDKNKQLTARARNPVIAGFAQVGYGLPGLNMFNTDFQPWALAGITVAWKPWDWKKNQRQRQIIDRSKQMLEADRAIFLQGIQQAVEQKSAEINNLKMLIEKDDQIIALREKVKKAAEKQLSEGTITSTDYLSEVNREKQAVLNRRIHRIQLIATCYEYLQTTGEIQNNDKN